MNTAPYRDPYDFKDACVHFWPRSPATLLPPGAVVACRVRTLSGSPLTIGRVSVVTCRRCLAWLAEHPDRPRGEEWTRAELVAAGLLDPAAPTPLPRARPYRNPDLPVFDRDAPTPLAALADRVAARAEDALRRGDIGVFVALRSVSAELVDLLNHGQRWAP